MKESTVGKINPTLKWLIETGESSEKIIKFILEEVEFPFLFDNGNN